EAVPGHAEVVSAPWSGAYRYALFGPADRRGRIERPSMSVKLVICEIAQVSDCTSQVESAPSVGGYTPESAPRLSYRDSAYGPTWRNRSRGSQPLCEDSSLRILCLCQKSDDSANSIRD